MRAIEGHRVRFGELAGPLLHGTRFFDYQLVSTQVVTAAAGHPFEGIVADDAIPYAPVGLSASVHRYPTFGDTLAVSATPTRVGDSSLELVYEVEDGGRRISTARMTHVTVAPEGGAAPIPEEAREAYEKMRADPDLPTDLGTAPDTDGGGDGDAYPTIERTAPVRSAHIEGSQLAYFEEYPRFAGEALESYLAEQGASLATLSGDRQPFRLRAWDWQFDSPVPFESRLRVTCDVRAVTPERVRVAHTFSTDGEPRIRGTTEYGCFDRAGEPVAFPEAALAPLEG